ncbi:MAG: class I SAM-dependent methyltransferase [Candidatus Buchananbacteria bacterium]
MSISTLYNQNDSFSRDARLSKILWLIEDELKNEKKCDILDVGCGDGKIGGELVKMGHRVAGVDVSKKGITEARDKGMDATLSQIEEFDTEKKYDLIIMTDILEHLFEPLDALKKAKKWLRLDGKMAINFPNHFDLRNRFRMFLGRSIVHWDHNNLEAWDYQHIRFLTLTELRKMVGLAGFYIEKEQFNFMGGGILPVKITPSFLRYFLVRIWPSIFSGKFSLLLAPNKTGDITAKKYFTKTLKGM